MSKFCNKFLNADDSFSVDELFNQFLSQIKNIINPTLVPWGAETPQGIKFICRFEFAPVATLFF